MSHGEFDGRGPRGWAVVAAGLMGAAGVALLARSAHGDEAAARLEGAAIMCLAHAPVVLALALPGARRIALSAGVAALLTAGPALFAADMLARTVAGAGVFAMAAPIGGGLAILGWIALAAAGLVAGVRASRSP